MAKATGPDFVALMVRDLARSRGFSTERLGLEEAPQGPPDAVVFGTQPIAVDVREPAVDLDAANRLGWGVALWLACDDADALHASLEEHGVTILQRPQDGPFGRQFSFADPDGYAITVHEGGR